MFRFPFTNFHELNLDWILSVVKEAKAVFDNGRDDIDYAVETADEAKEIAQQAAEGTVPDNSVTTPKIRDYAVTSDKIATYAVTTDKIQEGGVTAPKIASGLLYRPNFLDNWYFVRGSGTAGAYGVFPVNQRGQTSYSAAGFTIDRLYKATGKGTVYSTEQGLQFSTSDSDYATFLFNGQDVPAGVPAIYTVLTNLGITTVKTGGNSVTLPSGIIVYIDSSSRRLALRIPGNLSQNNSETFIAAKVELGSNQTLAHFENNAWVLDEMPDYSEQLAKCQRYFRVLEATLGVGSGQYYTGVRGYSDAKYVSITFDFEMSKAITASAPNGVQGAVVDGTGTASSIVSVEETTGYSNRIGFVAENNLARTPLGIYLNSRIYLSAE